MEGQNWKIFSLILGRCLLILALGLEIKRFIIKPNSEERMSIKYGTF